jgi:hypothetical protein
MLNIGRSLLANRCVCFPHELIVTNEISEPWVHLMIHIINGVTMINRHTGILPMKHAVQCIYLTHELLEVLPHHAQDI